MSWVFFVRGLEPYVASNALAMRVAETERVIAIGPDVSLTRSPAKFPLRKRAFRPVDKPIETYYRPMHFPVALPIAGAVCERLNVSLFRKEMGQLLSDRPDIVCYDSPKQHNLVGILGESLSTYYVMDDFTLNIEGRLIEGERRAEQRLLERMNLIICVSEPLADQLRERTTHLRRTPIHVLPNFYDERVFSPEIAKHEPDLLRRVPRPRVLVAGHISDRIDWEGIIAASKLKPDWSWVFLGRAIMPHMEARVAQLAGRGILLPGVPFAEVPAWIQHSDACAVPYRLNRFTLASDPLKAPEYLAMGAPVLSTRVPALARFDQAIYWVQEGDGASYAEALDKATSDTRNHELIAIRRRAAAGESLRTRTEQLKTIIQHHLNNLSNMRADRCRSLAG